MGHLYTIEDRLEQLKELKGVLQALIAYLQRNQQLSGLVCNYEQLLSETERLIIEGFDQQQLSDFSLRVPDVFSRHKDWIPPLESGQGGMYAEAYWFSELEAYLQPVLTAAEKLRVLGIR